MSWTWIITEDQKVWAVVGAILFAGFGYWCGRSAWQCVLGAIAIYFCLLMYAVSDNNMQIAKAEFAARRLVTE